MFRSCLILIVSILILNFPLFAETEANNTPATANIIAVNGTASGTLGDSISPGVSDDYDWYSLTLPSDGRLTLTATASGTGAGVQIWLYRKVDAMNVMNPTGEYLGSGYGTRDTVRDNLHAGIYYIQMTRSGRPSYALTAGFVAAALTNDAEMNDTPKVAITLALNTTTTGHMGYYSTALQSDTYDWFKVTTTGEGRLTVTTQTSDGNLDLQPYIYRQVNNMSDVNSPGDWVSPAGNAVNDTVTDLLRAGTYYIQLVRRSGIGSYTMNETFTPAALVNDAEPDDIPNQAQTIPLDSIRTGHMGYYSTALGSDNYDWFKVVVPTARTLRFNSLTTDGNLDFQLYIYTSVSDMTASNPSGTWYGGGGNQLRDTASVAVSAGTYYLQVFRRSGIGSYSVSSGSSVIVPIQPQVAFAGITPSLTARISRLTGRLTVTYTLAEPSAARVELYNVHGAMIASLRSGQESAGAHEVFFSDHVLDPGVYFCRLRAGRLNLSRVVRLVE